MRLMTTACLAGSILLAGCAGAPQKNGQSAAPVYPVSAKNTPPKTIPLNTESAASNAQSRPIPLSRQAGSRNVMTLTTPSDMWDRIRRGFQMEDLDNEIVREREGWYASRPDYIQRMTERSNKYIFHIVEELERRNMPTELALLPFVESAFNPQAVSSARAAGMWQFMPATGNDYDLKQNIFRDDRRDVIASTRAALDYLQRLYGMFGDWQLALAAYNWGEGNVSRAIAKNQRAGLPVSYRDLSMPAETRMYVPKLQAIKNIVTDPQRFNADLPLIPNHPYFQTVPLTRDVDVALAAKLADIQMEDFRALNPAAHKPVLLAAVTPEILLPWDHAAVFQRNFEAYSQGQYASWTAWVVPSTMTVAEAAQRSGMSEADLRALNNVPPRMLIKTGSTLIIPRSGRVQEDVAAAVAESGHLSFQPEIINRRTLVRAGRNDTLLSIARRYNLNPASVADWNNVRLGHAFKRGSPVVVYLPVRASRIAYVGSGRHPASMASRPLRGTHALREIRGGKVTARGGRSQAVAQPRRAASTPVKRKRR